MESAVVAVVGAGRIGAPTTEQLARQLPDLRLLVVDGDRVEEANDYPPFAGQNVGSLKVRVLESNIDAALGPSDRRRFVGSFFPDDFSPTLLSHVRVLVIAADNLRDRSVIAEAGRAAGAVVVNVAGWGDVGQLTVYERGPEGACMECELGQAYSLALPMAGTGAPGCAPAPATSALLASETVRVVRRLLQKERFDGVSYTFVRGRKRQSFRLTRSPRCPSPAHHRIEWRRVRLSPGGTLRQALDAAALWTAALFNPIFARPDCPGCGAHRGYRYDRKGAGCSDCGVARPLVWEIRSDSAPASQTPSALGLPSPACFRSLDGSVWVEVSEEPARPDPLLTWLDGSDARGSTPIGGRG